MQIKVDNIPEELKQMKNWVCWKYENVIENENVKIKKVPKDVYTGYNASSTNANTWAYLDIALKRLSLDKTLDGLGFMLSDGVVGIDIDHAISNSKLSELAQEIINTVDSYTEISPSGTGIHIFCKADLPTERRKKNDIIGLEIYSADRCITFTTNVLGEKKELSERTKEVNYILSKYLPLKEKPPVIDPPVAKEISLSTQEILEKALTSSDIEFSKLYYGDISKYNKDDSLADLALCGKLAFWLNGDAIAIDEVFRSSKLYRDKWNEKRGVSTYGQITIQQAINNQHNYYNASYNNCKYKGVNEMASKRMFYSAIASSTKFIKMPEKLQALYLQLGLSADDDGVVEAYKIITMLGRTEEDLKALEHEGFIIILSDDLIYMARWQEYNVIRADRKTDSIHKDLLLSVVKDIVLVVPKPRTNNKEKQTE